MKGNTISYYLPKFFDMELRKNANVSENTIISYKYAFVSLLQFVNKKYKKEISTHGYVTSVTSKRFKAVFVKWKNQRSLCSSSANASPGGTNDWNTLRPAATWPRRGQAAWLHGWTHRRSWLSGGPRSRRSAGGTPAPEYRTHRRSGRCGCSPGCRTGCAADSRWIILNFFWPSL